MKIKAILILLLILVNICAIGQNIKYSGVVMNSDRTGIEDVNILIKDLRDSSNVRFSFKTDPTGRFFATIPKRAIYSVRVSKIGYRTLFFNTENRLSDFKDTIILMRDTVWINAVAVNAKRPLLERTIDAFILNIEDHDELKNSNLLSILQLAPGTIVDSKGSVQINGNTDIKFMIDNRPVTISADNLSSFLRMERGANIKKIQIITNPSSKYEADGSAGIINIIRQKPKDDGYQGSISASYLYSKYNEAYLSPFIVVKKGKVVTRLNAGMSYEPEINDVEKSTYFPLEEKYLAEIEALDARKKNYYTSVNVSYNMNPSTQIGAEIGFSSLKKNISNQSRNIFQDTTSTKADKTELMTENPSVSLFFHKDIDTTGSYIDINIDGWRNRSNNVRDLVIINSDVSTRNLVSRSSDLTQILTFGGDYNKRFSRLGVFSVGSKYSFISETTDLNYITPADIFKEPLTGGEFQYKESTVGLYTQLKISAFKNWEFQVGVRGEYTNFKAGRNVSETSNDGSYFKAFPSVFVQKTFNNRYLNQLNFSATRRINRPQLNDLNPIITIDNLYSYSAGNMYLKPEYVNRYELSLLLFNKLSFYNSIQKYSNSINSVISSKEGSLSYEQTSANIARFVSYINSLSLPVKKGGFNSNISLISTYNTFEGSITNEEKIRSEKWDAYINMYSSANLPKQLIISLSGFYKSPFVTGQTHNAYRTALSAAVTKSWKDKIIVTISCDDPLKANRELLTNSSNFVTSRMSNKWNSRKVNLSIVYSFKKGVEINNREHNKSNSDETGRKN